MAVADPNDRTSQVQAEDPCLETARQASVLEQPAAADGTEKLICREDEAIARLDPELAQAAASDPSLRKQLDDAEKTIRARDETIAELRDVRAGMMRENRLLSAELSAWAEQLHRITSSPGWRLLDRYGRIKYRYLLPVYRVLGLHPYSRKIRGEDHPQKALPSWAATHSMPLFEGGQAAQVTSHAASLGQAYTFPESNAYDVVCLPIIDWDFRFQRPQQLMTRFAAAGHRVFYLSHKFRASGVAYTVQQKAHGVYEVSLRGQELSPYSDSMNDRACGEFWDSFNSLRRDLWLGATAVIVQLPFWWPLARQMRSDFGWPIIYDCMDYHAGFSTNGKKMLGLEEGMMSSVDLVVASSVFLENKARLHNSNVVLLNNACDFEHFARVEKLRSGRPVVGYYGAIAEWFDSDLVAELAGRRPDWDFVLVGSTFSSRISRLAKLSNVRLAGEKPYSEIPNWLGSFDVAIIPFKRTPLTEATNPVKAYEILASGKPLVSVPLPEMTALSPLVRLASSAEEFEKEICAAIEETGPEPVERRRGFAKNHTWEKRFAALAPVVKAVFPKASIIVVTFNNLHLSRLCIDSLYTHTEWPNFEVIVVDNASTDGTPDYLKEAEKTFPNLRVIFNDSNLGFAAANNIGLARAAGDYLVLLNNDTVVTRGWLSALIRHLHANPKIGLIGPVTNSVGNEAKIEVGYRTLDELDAFAAQHTRAHEGKTADIHVLAMFCVALRRQTYETVGTLDEQFGIGLFEDDDYAHRVKLKGLRVVCAADSFVHHFGQAAFKKLMVGGEYQRLFDENRRRYEGKWNTEWVPHKHAPLGWQQPATSVPTDETLTAKKRPEAQAAGRSIKQSALFRGMSFHRGRCNVCGSHTPFFYTDKALYRESLTCAVCLTTSRYRSIARGILRAIEELVGIKADSIAELDAAAEHVSLAIYDTQVPFYYQTNAYPIPDLLSKCKWVRLQTSIYRPRRPLGVNLGGINLGPNVTNQSLEALTYPDNSFDIVISSDVMEHVRLDNLAHLEIRRVLKPGGIYLFTVPHFRERRETFHRVAVVDPSDPSKDRFLAEKEYHGDANSPDHRALSYRSYGTDLDEVLEELGFTVEYSKQDIPDNGILNTELFFCRAASE